MSKLLILKADDWSRVYLDGEIISDGHSINTTSLLNGLIGKTLESYETKHIDDWEKAKGLVYPEDYFDEFAEEEKKKYFE